MKRILLAIIIFVSASTLCYGAGDGIYNNAIVLVKLTRPTYTVRDVIQDGTIYDEISEKEVPNWVEIQVVKQCDYMEFDVPFKVYSWNVYHNNQDISHSWHNRYDLDGIEVLARIGYKVEDQKHVDKMAGNMGCDWKTIQKDARYTSKYLVTKETALSAYDSKTEKIVKYEGIDKNDPVKFCQWTESKEGGDKDGKDIN